MCLILFATQAHDRFSLVVAANRDEAYSRPSEAAGWWPNDAQICAGRDLEHGGTWLGVSRSGRFAAITNYRQGPANRTSKRSRGELTRRFLEGSESPAAYLRGLEAHSQEYNGFSLLVGEPGNVWFYSNRSTTPQAVPPGVHGLSNHLLNEPWPKVRRGTEALRSLMRTTPEHLVDKLFELLADKTPAPDHLLPSTGIALERERALSASFIAAEHYGTRASTVLLVSGEKDAAFFERRFGPAGVFAGESELRFTLEPSSSLPAPARA